MANILKLIKFCIVSSWLLEPEAWLLVIWEERERGSEGRCGREGERERERKESKARNGCLTLWSRMKEYINLRPVVGGKKVCCTKSLTEHKAENLKHKAEKQTSLQTWKWPGLKWSDKPFCCSAPLYVPTFPFSKVNGFASYTIACISCFLLISPLLWPLPPLFQLFPEYRWGDLERHRWIWPDHQSDPQTEIIVPMRYGGM